MASMPRAVLVVYRPGRYRDRGARYRARVDGRDLRPGMLPNTSAWLELDPGYHTVAVASRNGRWSPPLRVLLAAGSPVTVWLLPASLSRHLIGRAVPTVHRAAAHSGKPPPGGRAGLLPPASPLLDE